MTALMGGIAAGPKPTAEKAIKDAYNGLKALLAKRHPQIDLKSLDVSLIGGRNWCSEKLQETDAPMHLTRMLGQLLASESLSPVLTQPVRDEGS